MKILGKIFLSYPFVLIMLVILGGGAAVATFIENDYGSPTAKVVVYNALWYEVVMISLAISMLGVIYKTKMWKHNLGSFIFHFGFVVVLIGAGLTRYYGYEGVMHIREGSSDYNIISDESYLQIFSEDEKHQIPLALGKIGNNHFKYTVQVDDKDLIVEYKSILFGEKRDDKITQLFIDVTYDGKTQEVEINGGHGTVEYPTIVTLTDDIDVDIAWGSKVIELDFSIELSDFQLDRYAGSMSPSSYASEVVLIDEANNIKKPFRIYMNNPLNYKNYKFFQSSYDTDEQGTVLSVNNDPGKWPTYIGYMMLSFGFILNFFIRNSRFNRLRRFLKNTNMMILIPFVLVSSTLIKADETMLDVEQYKSYTAQHASKFGELLIQDNGGRIKPMSSISIDLLNKISGKSSLYGLSAEQIILGMITEPMVWQKVKMIKIKNPNIKKFLNIDKSKKLIAFSDLYDDMGIYKLVEKVEEASRKDPSERGTFDRDLIKLDELLNISFATYRGVFFNFIPQPNDPQNSWHDMESAKYSKWIDYNTTELIELYMEGVKGGINRNDWALADATLATFKANQKKYSADILPSANRIKMEVLYNKIGVFQKLVSYYLILGLLALIFAMYSIFSGKKHTKIEGLFLILLFVGFIVHTGGLAARWYIAGHAPWSDAYESLVYVGWTAVLAGIITFRKSMLALAATLILAGVVMFVAHLNFISPQITNLVPVLKSYWLSIHVSIITGSYGFLGLSALLGLMAMFLMIFRNENNKVRLDLQIRQIIAINEISMIIGLALLSVGNFLGGVWANESWGRYWGWDPKETWAFVSIVVYIFVLHLKYIPKLNGIYVYAFASTNAFASILMTYFGVNYYLSGLHSYAAGDNLPIPNFIYYMGVFIAIVSILAYRKRDIKPIEINCGGE